MRPADKERFPDLDKEQRKNIAVLEERREYLSNKLDWGNCSPRSRGYLKDERDAIDWALGEVVACHSMVAP